jgi:hypothetical protein
MRTRSEKRTEPAYEVETTYYGCDHCGYETLDPEDLKFHHGQDHALKATKDVAGQTFYRFESKADMDAWISTKGIGDGWPTAATDGPFPGWFVIVTEKTRCRRNCCWNYDSRFEPWRFAMTQAEEAFKKAEAELETQRRNVSALFVESA